MNKIFSIILALVAKGMVSDAHAMVKEKDDQSMEVDHDDKSTEGSDENHSPLKSSNQGEDTSGDKEKSILNVSDKEIKTLSNAQEGAKDHSEKFEDGEISQKFPETTKGPKLKSCIDDLTKAIKDKNIGWKKIDDDNNLYFYNARFPYSQDADVDHHTYYVRHNHKNDTYSCWDEGHKKASNTLSYKKTCHEKNCSLSRIHVKVLNNMDVNEPHYPSTKKDLSRFDRAQNQKLFTTDGQEDLKNRYGYIEGFNDLLNDHLKDPMQKGYFNNEKKVARTFNEESGGRDRGYDRDDSRRNSTRQNSGLGYRK